MAPSSAAVAKVTKDLKGLNLRPKKSSGSKVPRKQLACGGLRQNNRTRKQLACGETNPNDERAIRDVKMAVDKFNMQSNRNLSFVSFMSGRRELCAGLSYSVVIAATEGGGEDPQPKKYHLDCWSRAWLDDNDDKRLIIKSFKQVQN